MTAPAPRRTVDVKALASGKSKPIGAVEFFVAAHGPIEGPEGVGKGWVADFFAMIQEAFKFGCETGRYEVKPEEGRSPEQAAARTRYADAAMVYHRHPTTSNLMIADEAMKVFRKTHHEDEEARRV